MTQSPQPFNPNDHITKLPQGKDRTADYLEVKWRLCWFRDQCAEGTITTELVIIDLDRETQAEVYAWNEETRRKEKVVKRANGWCLFKATVTDGKGATATAHGSEGAADFGDYVEKAETKAVGRALAMLGFGTQFTGDELAEHHRIVDAPVDRTPAVTDNGNGRSAQTVQDGLNAAPASDQQLEAIRKLRSHLGLPLEKRSLTYAQAKEIIAQLSHEYNEMKAQRGAKSA